MLMKYFRIHANKIIKSAPEMMYKRAFSMFTVADKAVEK